MKKIMSLLLSAVLLLSLTACANNANNTKANTSTKEKSTSLLGVSSSTKKTTISSKKTSPSSTSSTQIEKPGPSCGPKLLLNGKELDVYTSHYFVREEYAEIPLEAFLTSIGAEYANSPINAYLLQCYSFFGKRYVVSGEYHLFMLEEDYLELVNRVKTLTKYNTADAGLLPRNKNICWLNKDDSIVEWGTIFIDHISLMNVLKETGIDITIDYDYSAQAIMVTLPKQNN